LDNLIGYTSDQIEYVDYPQAKKRLETAINTFATEASQQRSASTVQALEQVQHSLRTQSSIEANQEGINQIQQQVTHLIQQEQKTYQSVQTALETDYDSFLASLTTTPTLNPEERLNQKKDTEKLAFNVNLFTMDKATESRITNLENPYKILLDNKAPVIEGFLKELNENSPAYVRMTPQQYETTKQTLSTLSTQIAGFYQQLTPSYQTTLQTKTGTSSKKMLTAQQSTSTVQPSATQTLSIDPSAYVKGIFAKNISAPKLTKVVYSDVNAEKI
jgi:hypothetical protein